LHWLERAVPSDWRVVLLADHRVWLETEPRVELPITAASLITEIPASRLTWRRTSN
jgi:hypothetical protein